MPPLLDDVRHSGLHLLALAHIFLVPGNMRGKRFSGLA